MGIAIRKKYNNFMELSLLYIKNIAKIFRN